MSLILLGAMLAFRIWVFALNTIVCVRFVCSLVRASTTTDLARRTEISSATASHHTTALRDAGLIFTRRHRGFATHMVTDLGLRMLTAAG